MGIELPAELAGVAAKAGVRWPAADEDRMRESAAAWRDAAKSIETLAGSADATAQNALRSFDGPAARAAAREWDGFVDQDGIIPVSARECTAAADRLDHAADRIGETKVQLVRELTELAKQTDVAEQAAKSGHPQALAALDSTVRGAAANAARLHDGLAAAVGPEAGAVVDGGNRPEGAATGLAASTVEDVAAGARQEAPDAAGAAAFGAQESVGGVATGAQQASEDIPPGRVGEGGPVGAEPGEIGRDVAASSTGPIPVTGGTNSANWPSGTDPASMTAPHAVQPAWAAGPPQPAQPAGQPPQAFGPSAAQQGGYAASPGGFAGSNAGGAAAPAPQPGAGASRPPAQAPGAYGQAGPPAPPARPGAGPQAPGPNQQQPNQQQPNQQQPNGQQPNGQQVRRAPLMPPQSPPQQVQAQGPESPQRGLRNGPRNPDAVAIVLHQFPIGNLPVASHGASRQLPPPEVENPRPGLNFPPQDHPESRLVDDAEALGRVRSGELYPAARQERLERAEPAALPESLLSGHDPLGELSELDWEHRYSTGDGANSAYVWPPAADFPEGGRESGQPVVLEPETVLDLLGDGTGRFFFAAATPFAHRSLPAEHAEREHRSYRVIRPLPMWWSVVAPWFEQPGGGVRYRATYSAVDLVGLGYLVELTRVRRNSEASTVRIRMSGGAEPAAGDEQEAE
ncbi:hypothetical protein GCM10009854_14380 [Saccharopolyspora halophila]|uniref:DUF4237 domain-containing protein n=1 Tax=Saccharopolyspora halophila TaxID=405551 RepID=A0ABN3FWB4_9PSEU